MGFFTVCVVITSTVILMILYDASWVLQQHSVTFILMKWPCQQAVTTLANMFYQPGDLNGAKQTKNIESEICIIS